MFETLRLMPKDPSELPTFQQKNRESMEKTFRSIPGLGNLMGAQDKLREWWSRPRDQGPGAIEREWLRGNVTKPSLQHYRVDPLMHAPLLRPAGDTSAISAHLGQIKVALPAGAGGGGGQSMRPAPVSVEETINHAYKAENSVTVTVPVQIVQKIEANADALARDVGRKAEHATRKALSDGAGPK